MNFYPERKDNSKAAFALGLGIGIAACATAIYAWKAFKETHPDFNLKEYCQKCGVISDECNFNCAESCETCSYTEPQYEPICDFEDIEIDLNKKKEEPESEDEEAQGRNLTGGKIISLTTATNKVEKIAKELYGNETKIQTDESGNNLLLTNDGKTRRCYMFWIERQGDDVTPVAVFYVDIITGEVFDNSEKGMNKLSD